MRSREHNELTRKALVWLSNIATGKGIRATTELTLAPGYIADAGAILNLQMKWDYQFFKRAYYAKIREQNNWLDIDDFSFVVESKASRSDFLNTFQHNRHKGDRLEPRGNFHFVVTTKGVCSPEEVPTFWGLLEESRNGLRLLKLPTFCPHTIQSLHEFAYRILRFHDERKFMIIDLNEVQQGKVDEKEKAIL